MNDLILTGLTVLMGILSVLGVMYLVEWIVALKRGDKECCTKTAINSIPPPEYDPKDVAFKSTPTPDQIIKGLKYIDDNEEYIKYPQETKP